MADRLTKTQREALMFYAGLSSVPPRGNPRTTRALADKRLIEWKWSRGMYCYVITDAGAALAERIALAQEPTP